LKPRILHILFVLFLLAVSACHTNKRQYTIKPSKSLINPDSDLLEVNAVAYHINDSATSVFLEIMNENLIYRRTDTSNAFYAEMRVSYKLLQEQNSRKIIDSSSFTLVDRATGENVEIKSIRSQFDIKAKYGSNYFLDIQVLDFHKKTKYAKGINIYKLNNFSGQNFLVTTNGKVPFRNTFLAGDVLEIQTRNPNVSKVTVDCYFKQFPIALPPFSSKDQDDLKYKPDSVFVINLTSNSFQLTMPPHGFYHIKANPVSNEGMSLLTFDKTFPGVSDSEEMIECTRYLMNKTEFEECKSAVNKKEAIDKFWIGIGGSNERAKELLKRYYGRVKEANKYYTSYTQGWKTDRGMIFVVFGPPTNIYKNGKSEVWVYGVETNTNAVRFVFNKTQNPFSDNDYILERSQFHKDPWYNAVDYWRQGHVYIDNGR
jgi:GWxTD domain-containing protein